MFPGWSVYSTMLSPSSSAFLQADEVSATSFFPLGYQGLHRFFNCSPGRPLEILHEGREFLGLVFDLRARLKDALFARATSGFWQFIALRCYLKPF